MAAMPYGRTYLFMAKQPSAGLLGADFSPRGGARLSSFSCDAWEGRL